MEMGRQRLGSITWPSNQWFWRDQDGTAHFLGQYGWGGMASFPIPGDYDGDGIMERAFYRPLENRWFIEGEADFVLGLGHIQLHAHHQPDGHLQLVQVCVGNVSVKKNIFEHFSVRLGFAHSLFGSANRAQIVRG